MTKSCLLTNITYTYPDREASALRDISLNIAKGSFVLVTGVSGSGKSTLGKVIKGIVPNLYGGILKGRVEAEAFGYVLQDPEKQMLMTTVEREIAFGMENLGVPYNTMRKRVAEILDYVGLSHLRKKSTKALSGGQQQKLAIGCAIAMGYRGLILDEPTGQLDPVSSSEILTLVKRLNEEMGMTIIIIEQKVDPLLEAVDRVLYLENGAITFDGTAQDFVCESKGQVEAVLSAFTLGFRASYQAGILDTVPLSVKSARKMLQVKRIAHDRPSITDFNQKKTLEGTSMIALNNVIFSYDQATKHLEVEHFYLKEGELMGVIGENGSGKSTLLKVMSGVLKPQKGSVTKPDHIGFLSQNPNDYFFEPTLKDEIHQVMALHHKDWDSHYEKMIGLLELEALLEMNPRDLSGGERQRAALAIVLASQPSVLLLDEPTRGLNKGLKRQLIGLLKSLQATNITIMVISHDMELIADLTDRIAIVSGGQLQIVDHTENLMSDGLFYVSDYGKLFAPFGLSVVRSHDGSNLLMNLKEEH
jgi:energy-coupling factor transport system ATP-binding protein